MYPQGITEENVRMLARRCPRRYREDFSQEIRMALWQRGQEQGKDTRSGCLRFALCRAIDWLRGFHLSEVPFSALLKDSDRQSQDRIYGIKPIAKAR